MDLPISSIHTHSPLVIFPEHAAYITPDIMYQFYGMQDDLILSTWNTQKIH